MTDPRSPIAFGPQIKPGATEFRLWAPLQESVRIEIEGAGAVPMRAAGDGWFEHAASAPAGTRYRFLLEDGTAVPDPASRYQPDGVFGPSEVVDLSALEWSASGWRGRPWTETVLYELHVGTFTPEGTFRAAIDKLDHLKELGVTAVELMPIATFAGRWGWGYDGVLPFAPHPTYGRPEDLAALVDAAHSHGMQVFLDVIYNHFGPEGNFLPHYAKFFTDKHSSPWGQGINFDDEGGRVVRDFFVSNALYWLTTFRMDGLRLDAVQEIKDDSAEHFLDELARQVRETITDRHVHLVLENAVNDVDRLDPGVEKPHLYTAQWNDDIHHSLHVALTDERGGYYEGFEDDRSLLSRAVAEGFGRQGQAIAGGSPLGKPSGHLPPTAFVSYLQNHDQVGNRALGERISDDSPPEAVRAAAALHLLSPQIPLLFMGEEWAASTPFPFFCDFEGDLADAVRKGRREEFAHFPQFSHPEILARMPDPVSGDTVETARLNWTERSEGGHAEMLAWYRRVIATRHAEIVPLLPRLTRGGERREFGRQAFEVRFPLEGGGGLAVVANISADPVRLPPNIASGRSIWTEGRIGEGRADPWSVRWSRES